MHTAAKEINYTATYLSKDWQKKSTRIHYTFAFIPYHDCKLNNSTNYLIVEDILALNNSIKMENMQVKWQNFRE